MEYQEGGGGSEKSGLIDDWFEARPRGNWIQESDISVAAHRCPDSQFSGWLTNYGGVRNTLLDPISFMVIFIGGPMWSVLISTELDRYRIAVEFCRV